MTDLTQDHRCDDSCVCPADGEPLIWAPSHGIHACSRPACKYAHGLEGADGVWAWQYGRITDRIKRRDP